VRARWGISERRTPRRVGRQRRGKSDAGCTGRTAECSTRDSTQVTKCCAYPFEGINRPPLHMQMR
jgi:hypothetical protein